MGIDLDNMNQVLLKPEFFAINVLKATHESPINDEIILKEIKAALLLDEVTKDYKSLLKSSPREFEKSLQDWNYENGLLLYRGKIYPSQCGKHFVTTDRSDAPQFAICWTLRSVKDLQVGLQKLLVAWDDYICQEIRYGL